MKSFRARQTVKAVAAGLLLSLGVATHAPVEAAGPLYGSTYPSKIAGKFGRGLGNIAFCWTEVPIEMNREIQNTDPVSGFFVGLGQGIWYTIRRFGLGVADVVTFPVDVYGNNFQSIQRTEFPFIDDVD